MSSITSSSLGDFSADKVIHYLIDTVEQGYVNNPKDPGGATKYGITFRVANSHKSMLVSQYDWDGTMQNLPLEGAVAIYKSEYWDALSLDLIQPVAPVLAYVLFNIGVNTGVTIAGQFLQTYLNVMNNLATYWPDLKVDGSLGPSSISALRAYVSKRGLNGLYVMTAAIIGYVFRYYTDLALRNQAMEEFEFGWAQRAANMFSILSATPH